MDIERWFLKNARVSRAAAARLAEISREEIDAEADDLGLGNRLSLEQLTELLEALEEDETDEDEEDEDEEEDLTQNGANEDETDEV